MGHRFGVSRNGSYMVKVTQNGSFIYDLNDLYGEILSENMLMMVNMASIWRKILFMIATYGE